LQYKNETYALSEQVNENVLNWQELKRIANRKTILFLTRKKNCQFKKYIKVNECNGFYFVMIKGNEPSITIDNHLILIENDIYNIYNKEEIQRIII